LGNVIEALPDAEVCSFFTRLIRKQWDKLACMIGSFERWIVSVVGGQH